MDKRILSVTALSALLLAGMALAKNTPLSKEEQKKQRMEEIMKNLPDSVFEKIDIEDLLDDEVYLKLAKDGWSPREISTIMETAVKDKKTARNRASYGAYAKEWRPAFGRTMSDDPLYQADPSALSPMAVASIYDAVGENTYNTTWKVSPYDPTDRKTNTNYQPQKGYFKPVLLNPSSGRVHWIVVNQANEAGDELYVVPDGSGIYSTHDCGKTWTCISDNIPERANRGVADGYAIPVDPDDWNHLFAYMGNSSVYETTDGGQSWTRVVNATHKTFKRGYAFKDKEGTLKLIGADMQNNRVNNKLWLSTDKGVTWTELSAKLTNAQKETVNNTKGFWFQQMAFDPSNRDIVYFPGSYSILRFTDGGRSGTFEKMSFKLYGQDKSKVRFEETDRFPFNGNGPGYMEIDPNNPDRMWFTVGNSTVNRTALYYSDDHGQSWITLHEPATTEDLRIDANNFTDAVGSGTVFGNEIANVWLGGFGIEYTGRADEEPQLFFGCSMSSAYSAPSPIGNGEFAPAGRYWNEYAWGRRQRSYITEGLTNPTGASNSPGYYEVSASRHNADNHCIASHKNGRVFRSGDGGLFVHDPKISGADGTNIGLYDWVNISSNLGQMLFYGVRVNEFGDQAIIGNTQDIDVQTYRYGRWGNWRGYEGTEASLNPYTSTGYFSGSGGEGPTGMNVDSWHSARNFADVVTGDWFMLRTWSGNNIPSTLYRIQDVGKTLTDLYSAVGKTVTDVGLCRDKGRLTVFVRCNDNSFMMSTDSCKTFQALRASNGNLAAFSDSKLAVDPDNSDIFYFGQRGGKVYRYDIQQGTWTAMGTGLPNIPCSRLLFHEGSGDLYYVDYNSGIYILRNGEQQWEFWTKGYNGSKFNDCDINYTTQEFVLADYGRGVWAADIETPHDRYFDSYDQNPNSTRALKIKEISHRDGRRVFGIDTQWTIPMYYNYHWYVKNKLVDNPYQYLNIGDDEIGDLSSIQLQLSLREAPYVTTMSNKLYIENNDTESVPFERHQGNALYSNGSGRVDIGYMDWFYNDFSVDFWLKPQSDGVILANTQKGTERGAKGWVLYIEGGVLKFKYYPSNQLNLPTYEPSFTQNPVISGPSIPMNKWAHVALTQQRHGNICLYVNGEKVVESPRQRANEPHTLNNSVIMSLFGDAFESSNLQATIDELKFWKKALTAEDVRREMFSTDLENPGQMVAHFDFNGNALEDDTESFTGYVPKPRTRAVTSAVRQTVPVSANYVAHGALGQNTAFKAQDGTPIMTIEGANSASGATAYVFGYEGGRWENADDNLSEAYYEPTSLGYVIRTFGGVGSDATANVTFHNGQGTFEKGKNYRLYMASNAEDRMYWQQYKGALTLNDNGTITLNDAKLADIVDKKLLLVTMKPAIELTLEGLSSDGRVVLYDDNQEFIEFPFVARLLENKKVKNNRYEIMSDSSIVIVPETALSFDNNGEARGTIKIDTELAGGLNNVISTFVHGKNDEDMIPIPIDILNRISPKTLNNSVQISKGCFRMGSAADFSWLKGATEATMMGWIRVDDIAALKKGRNGDGVAPVIFFRDATGNGYATGIHFREGSLGYHWNDVSWNYSDRTPFVLTDADQGRWVHVALVVKREGAWMYFNGMEYKMPQSKNPMPECNVQSPLLLGTNTQGNYSYFSGAFDHVALWSRALSQEEIHKYMHNRILLNAEGLQAYITMDEMDESGHYKESVKGFLSHDHFGSVTTGEATPVPFNPYRQDIDMTKDDSPIKLPGSTAKGCVASFEGTPFNFIAANDEAQKYLPLNHEYYTLIYNALPNLSGYVTLTYTNESLEDGDVIAVGIREVGSVTPFTNLIHSTNISNNQATFSVPASAIAKSSEIMFFATPETKARPTIVHMAFHNQNIKDGGIYLLKSGESEIDIDVNVVSENGSAVEISVVEDYAKLSTKDINLKDAMQTVKLTIDKEKLRKTNIFGLSDVTVNLSGVQSDPLTLKVGLQPVVKLSLKNGDGENRFVATQPISTLDINAELVEGYLTDNINLSVSPASAVSFNIATGKLLLNEPVTINDLTLATMSDELNRGWNLIGNPYLNDINLTKHQNYEYGEGQFTHFVYQTLKGSDNVIAYDMTDYDDSQAISPFQPFYVQTRKDGASFTVKEPAKEVELSRKTFDYYTANEVRGLTLELLDENDKVIDRTTVRWDENAKDRYDIEEDAPKVIGANVDRTNSLYTVSADLRQLSINFMPDNQSHQLIPLNVDVVNPGRMTLKVSRFTGFDNKVNNVYLVDFEGGEQHIPVSDDLTHEFYANSQGPIEGRFLIVPTFNGDVMTDADDILADGVDNHEYRVYTGKRTATVTGLLGDAEVNIYNTAGMLTVRAETSDSTFTTELETGAYVVRIRENGKDYVTKIVVK